MIGTTRFMFSPLSLLKLGTLIQGTLMYFFNTWKFCDLQVYACRLTGVVTGVNGHSYTTEPIFVLIWMFMWIEMLKVLSMVTLNFLAEATSQIYPCTWYSCDQFSQMAMSSNHHQLFHHHVSSSPKVSHLSFPFLFFFFFQTQHANSLNSQKAKCFMVCTFPANSNL